MKICCFQLNLHNTWQPWAFHLQGCWCHWLSPPYHPWFPIHHPRLHSGQSWLHMTHPHWRIRILSHNSLHDCTAYQPHVIIWQYDMLPIELSHQMISSIPMFVIPHTAWLPSTLLLFFPFTHESCTAWPEDVYPFIHSVHLQWCHHGNMVLHDSNTLSLPPLLTAMN